MLCRLLPLLTAWLLPLAGVTAAATLAAAAQSERPPEISPEDLELLRDLEVIYEWELLENWDPEVDLPIPIDDPEPPPTPNSEPARKQGDTP